MRSIVQYKYIISVAKSYLGDIIRSVMSKKMTIEDLAIITANGFEGVDKRFEVMKERIDGLETGINKRLDRIENLLLRDHLNRIERLEDTVLRLKVKAGIR